MRMSIKYICRVYIYKSIKHIRQQMENPITLEQQRKVWTIHQSVNGITYYYNRSTKKSQYQMPQCFKITQEDLDHPDWKQYRTAEGKKFYYNALTRKSNWHMPAEVKEWKMKIEDQKRAEREKNGNKQQQPLSQADEIKKKFMALLKSKQINVNTKWDVAIKLCDDDERWDLLKKSEKKQYFVEYINELKKISDLEIKAKTEANKIQFIKMLKEHKNLTSDAKMHRVQFDFITDPRWRILEGVEKENAFQDYMDELMVKEKQVAKKQRERNIELLKGLMEEREISYDTRWDQFRAQFRDQPCYKKLHQLDRIQTFSKYIVEAEERQEESEKNQKRMKQRTDRASFRELIKSKLYTGEISYKTKWRSFIKDTKEDQRLINMMDPEHKGSTAHEIFQYFMDGIKKNHKLFKSQIKSHFKKINFRMTEETPFSQFATKLSDLPLYADAKPLFKQYFYHYFNQKIKSKNAAKQERQKEKQKEKLAAIRKNQKRQRKAIFKIFKQYNESTKSKSQISNHIEKIEQNLKEQGIEITRENIFKYYLAYLDSADGDDDKKSRESEKSQRPKSRSKSSSSSRSKSTDKKKKKKKQSEKVKELDTQREKQKQKQRESNSNKKDSKNISFSNSNNPVTKSILIPTQLRNAKDEGEIEQQGEIKDDDMMEEQPKVEPDKNKQKAPVIRQKSREKSKQKKKKSSKKKKDSSSSDSD